MTNTPISLIAAIEALLLRPKETKERDYNKYCYRWADGYDGALGKVISIILQHEAEQPADVVERVARAIHDNDPEHGAYCWTKYRKTHYMPMAKAALSALNNCGALRDSAMGIGNNTGLQPVPDKNAPMPTRHTLIQRLQIFKDELDHKGNQAGWMSLLDEAMRALQQREITVNRDKLHDEIWDIFSTLKTQTDKLSMHDIRTIITALDPYLHPLKRKSAPPHDYNSFDAWCTSVKDCGHEVQPNSATARQRKLGWDAAMSLKREASKELEDLKQTAHMLDKYAEELYPRGEDGKEHFNGALMTAAAESIRNYLNSIEDGAAK